VAAQRSAAQHRAARDLELSADVLARGCARVALGDQRAARLEDERLDLARGTSDRGGDLRVAQIAQLEEHQCFALVVGQAPEVGHQLAQVSPAPDVLGQAIEAGLDLVDRHGCVTTGCERRATAVARDREQPWPHRVGQPAGAQRAMGAQEGLLQRVLTVLTVAEHVATEGQQRCVMAVVEDLEGRLVARLHERRKLLVVELARPTHTDAMSKNAPHWRGGRRCVVPRSREARPGGVTLHTAEPRGRARGRSGPR
jgi:hypothetical protein